MKIIGGIGSPFRPSKLPQPTARGLSFLHRHAKPVAAFRNTTTMVDHCGNTVPIDRLVINIDACGNAFCGGGEHYDCDACPGGRNSVTNMAVPPRANTWVDDESKVQLEPCQKMGWKNVQAFSNFYGKYPLTYMQYDTESVSGCVYSRARTGSSIYNTKYKTLSVTCSFALIGGSGDGCNPGYSYESSIQTSVNSLTGIITTTGFNGWDKCAGGGGGLGESNQVAYLFPMADWSFNAWVEYMTATPTGGITTCSIGGWQSFDGSGNLVAEATWDLLAGTFARKFYGTIGVNCSDTGGIASVTTQEESLSISETSLSYSNTLTDDGYTQQKWEISLTLSDPYTIADVYADAQALADEWKLNDDLTHPFRGQFYSPLYDANDNPPFSHANDAGQHGAALTDANGNLPHTTAASPGQHAMAVNDGDGREPTDPDWTPTYEGDPVDWIPTYDDTTLDWIPTFSDSPVIDGRNTVGVLVTRNQAGSDANISAQNPFLMDDPNHTTLTTDINCRNPGDDGYIDTYAQIPWVDPNAAIYDGSIIGSPLPAGYGAVPRSGGDNSTGTWDPWHDQWRRAACIDPETEEVSWSEGPEYRGATTPYYLPRNAPQWTNDRDAADLYPCAFIRADHYGIYLQKWVETKIQRPSVNFGRPFGADKFAYDEGDGTTTMVFEAETIDGSGAGAVVHLKNWDDNSPTSLPFTTSDIVGGQCVDGFYAVASVGTDTVTLGAKVYDLPSTWKSASAFASGYSDDSDICFGKLRNPNATGMDFTDATIGVGGRIGVIIDPENSSGFITGEQNWLSITTPEKVDITDIAGTVLASNVDLTRVDATHFTTASAYPTAKWIAPHGVDYKFADNRPKGDYVYRTWLVKNDDGTVIDQSQIQARLAVSNCDPATVTISPNADGRSGGAIYEFPSSINNGETWFGRVDFWMVDPHYQAPHKPVGVQTNEDEDGNITSLTWQADDGTGQADYETLSPSGLSIVHHMYYSQPPYVEARCEVPDGYPTPPLDITAPLSPPSHPFIGFIEGPFVDCLGGIPTPNVVTWLLQSQTVNVKGRFSTFYHDNGS